ncbi:ABC transporter ATP-binding protein [Adhaeribacter arboris]|uniref:ABC transporter ATP-binding protein n=1 Tax=Adhaeribacter arboris TaxID=2072846 RepID=A0A2T2YHD7_9BACT|nr:ABC transporter ATP-binding protein [Adhaeribacter arboris]PSR54923.1 ABC transporter ATP-binding protein [Adhaeribacter arboris]
MEEVITVKNLTKLYQNVSAVDHLSFSVQRGSICGFLGQNGAGKSTTIKMLLGMVKPTEGSGNILGYAIDKEEDSLEIRKRVAYVAEDKRLYDYMTVGQIIRFTKSFFPNWREDLEKHLLQEFRLPIDRKISKLSKGMRTQTALILGVCRNAEILILDEPSEGLDPVNNEKVLKLLVTLAAEGKTVLFSSHQVYEVEQVADTILMLHRGKRIELAPLDELKSNYKQIKLYFTFSPPRALFNLPGIKSVTQEGNWVMLLVKGPTGPIIAQISKLQPLSLEIIDLSLKDIFLENLKAIEEDVALQDLA